MSEDAPTEGDKESDVLCRSMPIGGMALVNGVLFLSERCWAAAVRNAQGQILSASGRRSGAVGQHVGRLPVARGVVRSLEGLSTLARVKRELPDAEVPLQARGMLPALAASALAAGVTRVGARSSLAREVAGMAFAVAPALLAIRRSPLAGYHGAEHMAISRLENHVSPGGDREELELASNARSEARGTREHERCGSNLLGPVIMGNLVGNVLLRKVAGRVSPTAALAVGALSLGGAIEFLRWASAHPRSRVARSAALPGKLLQRHLTTAEPSTSQLEVAVAALETLLRADRRLRRVAARD